MNAAQNIPKGKLKLVCSTNAYMLENIILFQRA